MNTRKDKIELLKAIQSGEIDPKQLSSEPVIVSAGKQSPVVYVGEAKILMEECLTNVKSKRNESSRFN
jgi:hypothetical protein